MTGSARCIDDSCRIVFLNFILDTSRQSENKIFNLLKFLASFGKKLAECCFRSMGIDDGKIVEENNTVKLRQIQLFYLLIKSFRNEDDLIPECRRI